MRNREISSEILLNLFDYDNGVLIWKNPQGRRAKPGDVAGYKTKNGYIRIGINGDEYPAHWIVWWMHGKGEIPEGYEIDHENHIRSDNRIDNLRLVTRKQNSQNHTRRVTNKSGYTGVIWNKRVKKWNVQVTVDGRCISGGYHESIESAIESRNRLWSLYGFHKNHGEEKK
jgi:hypothetical protein